MVANSSDNMRFFIALTVEVDPLVLRELGRPVVSWKLGLTDGTDEKVIGSKRWKLRPRSQNFERKMFGYDF